MKTGKPPCLPVSRDILWHILLALASYRVPRPVTERVVFPDCSGVPSYYVCPRCGITLEREFTAFCDRCGQRLDWRGCRDAKIIVWGGGGRPPPRLKRGGGGGAGLKRFLGKK